ncbi:helix-turn-helix domain-containing protein, partial [Acinetobacter baumannii]|uniref:helix-turn-helix domain-containing protein n=1 Tax=Acinetobacter baumannii TaxID=470 RepID=UPI0022268E99
MLESRKEGFSARKFAELIKRHPSTIYRELKRNSINDVYQAQYASDNTFARRRRGHRNIHLCLNLLRVFYVLTSHVHGHRS